MHHQFLKADQANAMKEIDCYNYLAGNAMKKIGHMKFGQAAAYLENAARSLRELERMQSAKLEFIETCKQESVEQYLEISIREGIRL